VSLSEEISTPDRKGPYVRTLFATIADRYDFITVALSYGQDRRWKKRLADLVEPRRDRRVLDLATGTGDIALALAARGADVVGLDVTQKMIVLARSKTDPRRPVRFVVGDMGALPFPGESFDAVTIGYGLRNASDLAVAIAEASRVLRAGGRLVSLDFNRPANRFIRSLYLSYLTVVGGALGWILHRDADTYRYIPASLRTYPGAAGVSRLLAARGFWPVEHLPVLGGLMSIHCAFKKSEV
jgi:demethylmenaquinone methyltransferase / 2-methoxy-6-polyprenyl-1,4-benzoquinol methylase